MRFIAVFMALLIASLPMVFAQSLDVTKFSGTQNIRNIAKTTDTLGITAHVSIPGDTEITPNQVRLSTEEGVVYFFESCAQSVGEGVFDCYFSMDISSSGGTQGYAVLLYNDDGGYVVGKLEVLTNDNVDPDLLSFSATPVTTGISTSLNFQAKDYAFYPGDTTACAGVGSLKVYENSLSSTPVVIPVEPSCDVTSSVTYTPKATGLIHLCGVAVDRIGRTSAPLCQDITVDRKGPDFKSFRVLTADGLDVYSIPPTGSIASIEVQVDDPSIDGATVRGDFGTLADNGVYNDRAPISITTDNPHTLTWLDIPLNKVSPCSFTVRASDTLGNAGSKTFTCTIVSDITPPQVLSASTGFTTSDGTILLGKQGTFTVTFKEAGMARGNAILDASALGLGSVRAASCKNVGENWDCGWTLPANVPSGKYSLTVQPDTTDDIGNAFGDSRVFNIEYDAVAPSLRDEPVVLKVYHTAADYGDQAVKGDVLELSYPVNGATTAVADFTEIGGEENTDGSCTTENDTTTCMFAQEVLQSGPYTAKIPVSFLDDAGNHVDSVYELKVFGLKSEANPNHWASKVDCSPDVIDRSTSSYLNNQVYCHVKLTSKITNAEIANVAMGPSEECVGDLDGSIADVSVVNAHSTDPYVRVLLATREYPEKTLTVKCPISILTKIGDSFLESPETEMVPITVQFGLGAQASLAQSIDSKVQDAVDEADALSKWLTTAKKFVDIADKICMIRTIVWDIIGALEVIVAVVGLISIAAKAIPGGEAATKPTYIGLCNGKETVQSVFAGKANGVAGGAGDIISGIDSLLKPFCNYMNCQTLQAVADIAGSTGAGNAQELQGAANTVNQIYGNPKESIVGSVANLCIPGIIYNVDKYRQIQCRYAVCLKRDVGEAGVPMSVCEDDKAYLSCLLVWKQAFALIPFAGLVEGYINQFKEIVTNPFAALATLVGIVCGQEFCELEAPLFTLCSAAKVFNVIGVVLNDYNTIKEPGYWSIGQGACDELKELD